MKQYISPVITTLTLDETDLIRTSGIKVVDEVSIQDLNGIDFSNW